MPIIKSAKKKLRQDKVKTAKNLKHKNAFKKALKNAVAGTKGMTLDKAYKAIDKAVVKKVIHKNKAARLKSHVSKRLKKAPAKKSK